MSVTEEAEEEYGDGLEVNCQTCLGDGFEECDDILGCFVRGCDGSYHTCPNCKGSGMAKDQCYW